MEGLNKDYLGKHKKFRTDSKKLATIFFVSALIVSLIVFWWLKLVGITVTGEAFCGLEEHTHEDDCYVSEIICGFSENVSDILTDEENTENITSQEIEETSDERETDDTVTEEMQETQESTAEVSEPAETETTTAQSHLHTDECYKKVISCSKTEHIHTQECFPDKTADVETVSDWLSTIEGAEITNNIPENLIEIAMSQMGYEESQRNFEYDNEGNKNGYTRYGEWYGNPYGKWNAMFVSFCLHYSNINNASELNSAGAETLRLAWQNRGVYSPAEEHTAQRGDIVFLDNNGDKTADNVGIILSANDSGLLAIFGDSNNRVENVSISNFDSVIGYGLTSELSFAVDTEYQEEDEESTTAAEEETESEAPPLMMFSTTRANITYVTDLSSVIVDVSFKTLDDVEISNNSTVYIGQTYVISMEFSEDNEGTEWVQFSHNDDHFLTYQIPSNIHCEPFTSWHPISAKTENGTVEDVGEYFVDADGYLRVRFFDDENGICFGQRYSNVDFIIEFNATVGSSQSDTTEEVVFNDKIHVNFEIDSTAEMVVSKTHGSYDSKNNTLEYEIRVEATKAVVKDLVVYDDIYEENLHHALKDTVVVTDLEGNILDPQPTVSGGRYGNLGFTLTDFPDFAAGEGYIIKYKAAINDNALSKEEVGMWNGAYLFGENVNGEEVEAHDDDWVEVELNKIEKEGQQSILQDDDGNYVPVIEWEIEIKKSDSNLQGTVVVDTLGAGLEYYTDESIRVKRYDQWGNRLADSSISWSDVEVNDNTMSFALPEGYRFVIVYYTTYEELDEGEQKHYTNTAKVTINQKEEVAGGSADVVGFVPRVSKSASGTDGEYVYFTIEVDVPAVIKDWGGFFLTDLAAFWSYNENSEGYLYVENMPQDLIITAVTDNGRTIDFTPYVAGGPTENTYILVAPAEGDQYHSFNIFFNASDADPASSKWILDEDATLTISYKIPFDANTGVNWEGELTGDLTLEDVLLQNYKMANEAYFNYTDIIRATGVSTYEYSPKITKDSVISDDGVIDYTVVFNNAIPGTNGNGGYINGSVDLAYFTDTFDERLEYVPGSLMVTGYSPWQNGLWLAKYKYNGAVNGNTINVSSRDFLFYDYNEDANQYGWNGLSGTSTFRNYYRWVNAGGKFVFTYQLRVKDEYLYTTEHNMFELDNTAELLWGEDNSSGPVTDTAVFETGLLDKHATQENNKLNFDIHVNRRALDILEGSSTLTIEDTMTHNLSVYWDSIKLYYEDQNKNWIDFDAAGSAHSYNVTYDQASNRLTFVVPDQLHIRIDYTTLVTESGLVSVDNAVRIDGKAQVSDIIDAIFKVEQHSGGASGSIHNVTLLKQDGNTDMPLPDVSFLFYGPVGDPDATVPSGVQESIITEDGSYLYYIGSYTTGADGTVKIETQYLTLGGPYALVENFPPIGYNILEKPVYFYFYSPDPNGVIQTVTTLIAVENYAYGFVLPETGGTGTLPLAIIGFALMAFPILYSKIRRKRERRFN